MLGLKDIKPDWKWHRCGDIIDVRDGTHDSPSYLPDGVPLITSKNLKAWGLDFAEVNFIGHEDHMQISKRSKVDRGDILFAMIGTIGNPVIVETDIDFSIKNVALFKFDNSIAFNRYFRHLLLTNIVTKQLTALTRGGTQKFVSLGALRELTIPIPPLSEQRRIADILDRADALRTRRKSTLAHIDTLVLSIFFDMFGDPRDHIKKSKCVELADIVAKDRIVTYGIVQAGPHVENGVPYIRTGDIQRGEIQIGNLARTSPEIAKDYARSAVRDGDIVMSIRATVGTTALVPKSLHGANLTQGTARISPGREVHPEFLLWYLRTDAIQSWIQSHVKGATFREITLTKLRTLPVYVPSADAQEAFIRRLEVLHSVRAKVTQSQSDFSDLFYSLQHRAFLGEL